MLEQVNIVLVGTSHSGNIGSAARAMKVMGFNSLVLVDPQCELDEQAYALASGADDVIANATIVNTLEQGVADCMLVLGSSARSRSLDWPQLTARQCGETVIEHLAANIENAKTENLNTNDKKIALVFGRERTGLINDELQLCQYHVSIPANPDYSSLNLAMAVQTFCYEIRMALLAHQQNQYPQSDIPDYPRHDQLELFYQHLQNVLLETEFLSKDQPNLVMNKFRRLFSRARPEQAELNILRGVLTSIEKMISSKNRQ